eukprot:scaffold100532_cov54-Phaeocystis_antarctica.AAC.1
MHRPCSCHAHTMHRPCTYHAHAMHMPCTCHAHAMHMPCTYQALNLTLNLLEKAKGGETSTQQPAVVAVGGGAWHIDEDGKVLGAATLTLTTPTTLALDPNPNDPNEVRP